MFSNLSLFTLKYYDSENVDNNLYYEMYCHEKYTHIAPSGSCMAVFVGSILDFSPLCMFKNAPNHNGMHIYLCK